MTYNLSKECTQYIKKRGINYIRKGLTPYKSAKKVHSEIIKKYNSNIPFSVPYGRISRINKKLSVNMLNVDDLIYTENRRNNNNHKLKINIEKAKLIINDSKTTCNKVFLDAIRKKGINNLNDIYGIIFETTNYSQFKKYPKNRDIKNLNKILEYSMKKYGFIHAGAIFCIIFNGELMIIDGHNRLESALNEAIPVKFMICEDIGIEAWEIAESEKKHTLNNYLTSNLRDPKTNETYSVIARFKEELGTGSIKIPIKLLGGYPSYPYKEIKQSYIEGSFEIYDNDFDFAEKVKDICLYIYHNCDYEYAIKPCCFIEALSMVLLHIKHSSKRIKQLKNKFMLTKNNKKYQYKTTNIHDALEMIEKIFNYNCKKSIYPLKIKSINTFNKRRRNE